MYRNTYDTCDTYIKKIIGKANRQRNKYRKEERESCA